MNTRRRLAAALAAGVWGFACAGIASADYRKDPAVRAAVEEKLKTTDEAEIRKRWGSFADLVDKVWMYERSGSHTWFHLRWAVPGAVMEYSLGHCPGKKCSVRKAVLVHKPAPEPAPATPPRPAPDSGGGFSLSGLTRGLSSITSLLNLDSGQTAFEVLWEDGGEAKGELVEGGHVKMDGYTYEYDAAKSEINVRGIVYKANTPAQLLAATGYALPGAGNASAARAASEPSKQQAAPAAEKSPVRGGTVHATLEVSTAPEHRGMPYFSLVVDGGAAASAGILKGDLVQAVAGIERPTKGDVLRAVLSSPGQALQVVVLRLGKPQTLSVPVKEVTLPGPCIFIVDLNHYVAGAYQYEGECKDGFAHGQGVVTFPMKDYGPESFGQSVNARYVGSFARGEMEGRGKMTTPSLTYEGEFRANLRHGRGKLTYADGRAGFEGRFVDNNAVGLKAVGEAVVVCTRPDASGKFECDTPQRAGVAGRPGAKGRPESPHALLASDASLCPSQRRLPSRTHLVWGCGFGATNAPGAVDRGAGIEMRGRASYYCTEREAGCKRTDPI